MGVGSRDLWSAVVGWLGNSVRIGDGGVGFLWQRSAPLESHVKDESLRHVHERFGTDPNATSAFVASQTTPQPVLLRANVSSKFCFGTNQLLAPTGVVG